MFYSPGCSHRGQDRRESGIAGKLEEVREVAIVGGILRRSRDDDEKGLGGHREGSRRNVKCEPNVGPLGQYMHLDYVLHRHYAAKAHNLASSGIKISSYRLSVIQLQVEFVLMPPVLVGL